MANSKTKMKRGTPMTFFSIKSVTAMALFCALIANGTTAQEVPSNIVGVTTMAERVIPAPPGLSPEMLEVVKRRQIPPFIPAPQTLEEWAAFQDFQNAPVADLAVQFAEKFEVTYKATEIAGVSAYIVTPKEINPRWADRVFMHNHGGAWVFGGGLASIRESIWLSSALGVQVVTVDYRKPPVHPFPAAVDDAVAVWSELTKDGDAPKMAMFGTSAGGNVTLAATLKLKDMGADLPGAIFAGTPATDLENVSDTWLTFQGLDPLGERTEGSLIGGSFAVYIGDSDPADPYLSPVNGNMDGFPPTILIV